MSPGERTGPPAALPASLEEVKAFLRLEAGDEDALLAGLVRSAASLCEAFTGQVLLLEERRAEVAADGAWHRLAPTPMRRVVSAEGVDSAGAPVPLADGELESQIDFCGDGWVRISGGAAARAVLSVEAGLAAEWNDLPEPLRQGIVRLTAHLYTRRDDPRDAGPPAAIAALWRPWCRMRLS